MRKYKRLKYKDRIHIETYIGMGYNYREIGIE